MESLGQDAIFLQSEGDRWFARNRDHLERFDPAGDLPMKLVDLYGIRPRNVLEIGAANGFRLAALQWRYGCRAVALECSADAVADGRARYPSIEFVHGGASSIALDDAFDLVIVNFVFHWIDRCNLLRAVAEIDRLLADSGFLVIGDFLPSAMTREVYHHLPEGGVYTYKQDYASVFVASGQYQTICLLTGDHASKGLVAHSPERDRIGTWLLRKALGRLYARSFESGSRRPSIASDAGERTDT